MFLKALNGHIKSVSKIFKIWKCSPPAMLWLLGMSSFMLTYVNSRPIFDSLHMIELKLSLSNPFIQSSKPQPMNALTSPKFTWRTVKRAKHTIITYYLSDSYIFICIPNPYLCICLPSPPFGRPPKRPRFRWPKASMNQVYITHNFCMMFTKKIL